jgi:hypothetical protein
VFALYRKYITLSFLYALYYSKSVEFSLFLPQTPSLPLTNTHMLTKEKTVDENPVAIINVGSKLELNSQKQILNAKVQGLQKGWNNMYSF